MTHVQALGPALVQLVRALLPGRRGDATSLVDMRDGRVLEDVLRAIDPEFFGEPSRRRFEGLAGGDDGQDARLRRLRSVYRRTKEYMRDVCEGSEDEDTSLQNVGKGQEIDLESIARSRDAGNEAVDVELTKLLVEILRAGMYSPVSNQWMAKTVMGLGPEAAAVIAGAMSVDDNAQDEELEKSALNDRTEGADLEASAHPLLDHSRQAKSDSKHPIDSAPQMKQIRDVDLEHEEQLVALHRTIRELETMNARAASEIDSLREEKNKLEAAFASLGSDASPAHLSSTDAKASEKQHSRDEDAAYIADLEHQLGEARSQADNATRQMERLRNSDHALQGLKDEIQLLRAERDDLASRGRTAENLKKKIVNLQALEAQHGHTREELRLAREELGKSDKLRERCEALQRANTENMNIIASSEQELFEMRTARKRVEHEMRVLSQKWEMARERGERDREVIAELERKVAEAEEGKDALGGEIDEVEKKEKPAVVPNRRISSATIGKEEVAILEERLRNLERRNKGLEESYLDLLSDKLGLETTLTDAMEGQRGDSTENVPFLEQRAKLEKAHMKLQEQRDSIFALTSELAATKQRLLESQDGTSKVPVDSAAEYSALSKSYAHLTTHSEELQAQLAEHKALLRYSLLSAKGLDISTVPPKDSTGVEDAGPYDQEAQLIKHILAEALDPQTTTSPTEGISSPAELTPTLDAITARLIAHLTTARTSARRPLERALADRTSTMTALQTRLAKAEQAASQTAESVQPQPSIPAQAQSAGDASSKQPPPPITNSSGSSSNRDDLRALAQLRRENLLMTSAWHDLTARLQRENVILGRRRETPKSWLGKMRVGAGLGVAAGMGAR